MYGKCPGCVKCLVMTDTLLVQSVLLMSSSLGVIADISYSHDVASVPSCDKVCEN